MFNSLRLLALPMVAAIAGCTPGNAVTVTDTMSPSDCAGPDAQRLITYCASPQAADLALTNAELMALAADDGEVASSPLPIGESPTLGPADAPVTIVMFTDLECPYCRQMHENIAALMEQNPDDVRLVFKHTPLSFHPNAVPAALASLAAREQGRFWEYVDRVYAQQDELDREALLEHARAVGLDVEQFKNDFGSESHIGTLEGDLGLAGQSGVSGTPTLFVNGLRVVGVYPTAELQKLVDQQKELRERLARAGVPEKDLYWRLVSSQYRAAPVQESPQEPEIADEPTDVVAHVPVGDAPVRGANVEDALVTIVEFSDFQCPYCAAANEIVDEVMDRHGDATRLAFRHFPLPNHPDAGAAAIASIAAQQAGKFWELHDAMFARQDALSVASLKEYATQLGLDPASIEQALADERNEARVVADQKLGLDLGVRGTPTFFVNGIMVAGVGSPEEFEALVAEQKELARAVSNETGLVGEELYRAVVERNKARQ